MITFDETQPFVVPTFLFGDNRAKRAECVPVRPRLSDRLQAVWDRAESTLGSDMSWTLDMISSWYERAGKSHLEARDLARATVWSLIPR